MTVQMQPIDSITKVYYIDKNAQNPEITASIKKYQGSSKIQFVVLNIAIAAIASMVLAAAIASPLLKHSSITKPLMYTALGTAIPIPVLCIFTLWAYQKIAARELIGRLKYAESKTENPNEKDAVYRAMVNNLSIAGYSDEEYVSLELTNAICRLAEEAKEIMRDKASQLFYNVPENLSKDHIHILPTRYGIDNPQFIREYVTNLVSR